MFTLHTREYFFSFAEITSVIFFISVKRIREQPQIKKYTRDIEKGVK